MAYADNSPGCVRASFTLPHGRRLSATSSASSGWCRRCRRGAIPAHRARWTARRAIRQCHQHGRHHQRYGAKATNPVTVWHGGRVIETDQPNGTQAGRIPLGDFDPQAPGLYATFMVINYDSGGSRRPTKSNHERNAKRLPEWPTALCARHGHRRRRAERAGRGGAVSRAPWAGVMPASRRLKHGKSVIAYDSPPAARPMT